jgi:hypothetical protein
MPARTAECPRCGAPVLTEPGARSATCLHCGSRFPVGGGASGGRAGAIDEIRGDADLIARRTAATHLEERALALARRRAELWAQWQREVQSAIGIPHAGSARTVESIACSVLGAVLLVVGAGLALAGAGSAVVVALIGAAGLALGLVLAMRRGKSFRADREQFIHRVLSEAEGRYGPRVSAMDAEIRATRERIADLSREIDRLAWDL